MMKAAVYTKYGPPERVSLAELPVPTPSKNQVLVEVHTATVNRTDCGFRSAEYFISRFFSGLFNPKIPVLGCEYSGKIVGIGSEVTEFKIGDLVFGFNDKTFGAHAEFLIVEEKSAIATIPKNIEIEYAAALTEGIHYAWCDIRAAKVQKGQRVLVNGGTGAIGSGAIQLLKHVGAEVTAVCHGDQLEKVRFLGADHVLDYTQTDFTKLPEKYDFVFDTVGKRSFRACLPVLKPKGIYISTELGYLSQNPFLAILTPMFRGKKLLFPIPSITKSDVEFFKSLVETGELQPLIDRMYTLDQIVEAYRYVETGEKIGNVLIKVK